MSHHLSIAELQSLFQEMGHQNTLDVTRIRYKNRQELRSITPMRVSELQTMVLDSIEENHLWGGDLEVALDASRVLVGHHDGIYWIEAGKE